MKDTTSSGEGSVPVKSMLTLRRNSVSKQRLEAEIPNLFSFAPTSLSIGLRYFVTSICSRFSVIGRKTGIAAMPLSYSATMWVSPFPLDVALPNSSTKTTASLLVRKRVNAVTSSRWPSSHSATMRI